MQENPNLSEIASPARSSSFIVRLWNGEISLAKTYWLFGVLGGVVSRLLSPLITYVLTSNASSLSAFDIAAINYLWSGLVIGYFVVVYVGIWRSSNRYAAQNPTKRLWANLAKAAVILGSLAFIKLFVDIFSPETPAPQPNSASVDERMQYDAMIAGLNANLPQKLDAISTITRIDFKNNSLIYNIHSSVKIEDVEAFNQKMHAQLLSVCTDAKMRDILKSNISLTYAYSDPDTPNVSAIVVQRADCPNL